jgi:hypothetical protein
VGRTRATAAGTDDYRIVEEIVKVVELGNKGNIIPD